MVQLCIWGLLKLRVLIITKKENSPHFGKLPSVGVMDGFLSLPDVICYGLFGLGRQRAVHGAGMPRMGTSMRGLALRDIARLDTVGAARILE